MLVSLTKGAFNVFRTPNCRSIIMAIAATIALLHGVRPVFAAQGSYPEAQAARACIHKRLAQLIAQDTRSDVITDPSLIACTVPLRLELKRGGKTDCEATDYIRWMIANENSKLYRLSGRPYKPNKSFIRHCQKSAK